MWFSDSHQNIPNPHIHTHTHNQKTMSCYPLYSISCNQSTQSEFFWATTNETHHHKKHRFMEYTYYQFLVKWTHIISESANLLLPWTVFCRILPFLRYLSTSNSSIFMPSLSFEWVSHPISWCLSVSDSVDHHKRPLPITKGKMIIIEFENPIWFFYHKYRHGHTERNKKKRSMEEKMIFFSSNDTSKRIFIQCNRW